MSETESTHEAKADEFERISNEAMRQLQLIESERQEQPTWRDVLGSVIQDPQERRRIANELGINPVTLTRWVNKDASPRPQSLQRLLKVLPQHHNALLGQLIDEFGGFIAEKEDSSTENLLAIGISFRIVEEPLSPQNMALILTALTELTTKLWLIEKRRFADLIEYTQTHDIRFANEAGTTIAWATYNSPFSFGFQVDKLVPSVAEAVMAVVDGLSQRKAHLEKLEIENLAAAQKIKEAEEKLKQQQDMAAFEREKQEIALEKLRLENEKKRQALIEQRLESQRKQIEDALELAGKAVDIVYPNADANMRPMLIQTVMNNILQLQSATGLELIVILPENKDEDSPKED